VSTQLIEAGVDLSFPRVLRAYGPLNRIIQAAGRCNREGLFSRSESEVIVFEPADGGEPRGLYKIECQQAKLFLDRELGERDLADPDVPTDYFARLYRALDAGLDSREVQRSRAAFDFPETARKVKFIDDDTVAVFCRYDDDAENVLREIEDRVSAHLGLSRPLWRTVQPYVVAIRRTDVPRLVQAGKLAPLVGDDLYLWTAPYDPIRGIGGNVLYDPTDLMA